MKNFRLQIRTKDQKYSILIGNNIIEKLDKIINNERIVFNNCLIIFDNNLPKKFLNKVKKKLKKKNIYTFIFKSSERNKNFKSIDKILEVLFKKNFNRNDCIISLGGGIIGDVSAFAASIFKRGIKFINIPTTLLAQVDSSIGGKTGINNIFGKNLVGTFYQPKLVLADIELLKSLPKREIICGYGEIFKHSIIASKKNFLFLNKFKKEILDLKKPFIQKAIYESCKIKKKVVEIDEKEKSLRKILNFGHTFAHAYEASLKFSNKLNHGEAVILGILSASKFSYENKFLKKNDYYDIKNHIKELNLNISIKKLFKKKDVTRITNYMKMDKKNNSKNINLILLSKIGKTIINKNFNDKKIKSFLYQQLL